MKAYIFPTFACTLACPRCYQKHCKRSAEPMLWETFKNIRNRLVNFKLKEVAFTGGEATCWPHLVEAIRHMRKQAKVRVVTNGFGRTMKDYGDADIVQVSDYGAINRMDYYRLKQQGGRRVRIQSSVHWDWDRSKKTELPGSCGCVGLSFAGDRVWPCAMAAAMNTRDGVPIEEVGDVDLRTAPFQELCRSCLVNRKNRKAPKPVIQLSVWGAKSWIRKIW